MRNMIRGIRRSSLVIAGLALAATGIAVSPASATPSTLGFYPSTDIYGKGNFHLDVDAYTKTSLKDSTSTTSGITYGTGPDTDKVFGRTEVGFDYNFTTMGDVSAGKRIFFNAKTQLYNNDASGTRLVAGGWGLGDDDLNPNYLYLLGSKNFEFGRLHLGVARALSEKVITNDRTSIHLAYDKMITPKLGFVCDYYSGKGAQSGVQPTFYYYPNDKCDFGLGWFRANNSGAAVRNQLYICFDYNFEVK